MKSFWLPFTFTLIIISVAFVSIINGEVSTIPLPNDFKCPSTHFFDSTGLICTQCNPELNLIPSIQTLDVYGNSMECICFPTALKIIIQEEKCSQDEWRRGICPNQDLTCASDESMTTCHDWNESVSMNGEHCVSCATMSMFTNATHESSMTLQEDSDNITSSSSSLSYLESVYNKGTQDCDCENPLPQITLSSSSSESSSSSSSSSSSLVSTPVLTRRLVEIYHPISGIPTHKLCLPCPTGTAVISTHLLSTDNKSESYRTAGVLYTANPSLCVSCPDPHMYFNTNYECVCSENYILVGESTVGPLSCISYTPTIMTQDYTLVEYYQLLQPLSLLSQRQRQPQRGGGGGGPIPISKTTLHSIVFSHYYLSSASTCEYRNGSHKHNFAACQTLGNLCVLSSYNEDSNACLQFQQIIRNQRQSQNNNNNNNNNVYHSQKDWNYGMPWLYYPKGEANDILNDRGIDMTIAFSKQQHINRQTQHKSYHELRFVVAKYALNGSFLGLHDLSTQFFLYCGIKNDDITLPKDNVRFAFPFGNSFRQTYSCPLSNLLSMETYFYDLYIVDEGNPTCQGSHHFDHFDLNLNLDLNDVNNNGDDESSSSTSTQCLYPIPVLNRNLVLDGSFPNMNFRKRDELDDQLVRRFFLVDNVSGRTASSVKLIRYAKTIVLDISIQIEDKRKIYPPRLTIDYAQISPQDIQQNQHNKKEDTLICKVEYSMKTNSFWASVKIITGFASAMGIVIWMLRINLWYSHMSRGNHHNRDNNYNHQNDPDSLSHFMYMVHVLMLGCHTFVWVFTPLIFSICAYWFVFFKLQAEVFLLLPFNNEFYGVNNEYYFFNAFFYALFALHTIYIFYAIYRQCNHDIFMVDWEQPPKRHHRHHENDEEEEEVSAWRSILIAKEWNKLQSMRKTSIELTLVWIVFLFIGRGLDQNSISQPHLNHDNNNTTYGYINVALRFTNTVWWWGFLSAMQWAFQSWIWERYVCETPSQYFINLCTLTNISLLIMDDRYHGYYLHGRSPYEFADCSMNTLIDQMKREENGFMTERGLGDPEAPRDCQSFEFFSSRDFREHLDKTQKNCRTSNMSHTQLHDNHNHNHSYSTSSHDTSSRNNNHHYNNTNEINTFLQSFLDQSPPPLLDGLQCVFRKHSILERILGMTPGILQKEESKCILCPKEPTFMLLYDYGFVSTVFLGMELDLLLHDVLCFNVVDLWFDNNTAISVLFTYLMHLLRVLVRDRWGRSNVSHKTGLDHRFFQ